jgi:hypothetical protein
MTKQHFIALADRIKACNSGTYQCEPFTRKQIEHLAAFCGGQNARFDRDRWINYIAGVSGPNGGKR